MYLCQICGHTCRGTLTITVSGREYEACNTCRKNNEESRVVRHGIALALAKLKTA